MTAPAPAPTGVLRHLQLHVKILDSGALVVSTPQARERADTVRGPEQLWSAVHMAMARARMAGHQTWAWPAGDDDATAGRAPGPGDRRRGRRHEPRLREGVSWSKNAAARPDVTDTAEWTPLPDGSWLSPAGKRYRSQRVVCGIVARRAALGLPICYESAVAAAFQADQAGGEGPSQVDRLINRVAAAATTDKRWHTNDRRNPEVARGEP